MKGIIFDIQKFGIHDGPGIRTVVFLKGCPLKCVWCCNPESISDSPQLRYFKDKCTNCFKCLNSCKFGALVENNGSLGVNFNLCTACGECVGECVYDAITVVGYGTSVQEIIHEVDKDRLYYKNSGGGMTLSGGAPLYQFEFAQELLKAAKKKGINTCVETEGYGPKKNFSKLIPYVDYFYFDYKITDEKQHLKYVGVSNRIIISNLEYLCKEGANITLRCIIVPKINDNRSHFRTIASLSRRYKSIRAIEIMPYHDFGKSKYEQIGMSAYPITSGSVGVEKANKWRAELKNLGCKNVKLG